MICFFLRVIIVFLLTLTISYEALASPKTISIDLQNASIFEAIEIFSRTSDVNIVTHKDVKDSKVTVTLKDVPWKQAFEMVLRTAGLHQVREGNVIYVVPLKKINNIFSEP
jgi:protein transport protein HofQ